MQNSIFYMPYAAKIVGRIDEAPNIFTLKLRFIDPDIQRNYSFEAGQFNMLYLFGIGEVAISIVSDPADKTIFAHTIRSVGRVTKGLSQLKIGNQIGIRGPFGRGWPVKIAEQKDVIIITGGLGCAPVTSAINYVVKHRRQYGKLTIMQGVKCSSEYIYCERYDKWRQVENTEVIVSADSGELDWPWAIGFITEHIKHLTLAPSKTIVMMCGPEIMMQVAAKALVKKHIAEQNLYLSLERNMQCGVGHCGHCQFGRVFVCKDGPVFPYNQIKSLLGQEGF